VGDTAKHFGLRYSWLLFEDCSIRKLTTEVWQDTL